MHFEGSQPARVEEGEMKLRHQVDRDLEHIVTCIRQLRFNYAWCKYDTDYLEVAFQALKEIQKGRRLTLIGLYLEKRQRRKQETAK